MVGMETGNGGMMETYKRICIKTHTISDQSGNSQTIERGREYTTSRVEDGKVMVFSTFWVDFPVELFAGEIRFT